MRAIILFFSMGPFISPVCAHAIPTQDIKSCIFAPEIYKSKAKELEQIEKEDQEDREGDINSIDWAKVQVRDLWRRVKVAKIFAEECFLNANDYLRAARVFQHGDSSDHYYQAFIWANKA